MFEKKKYIFIESKTHQNPKYVLHFNFIVLKKWQQSNSVKNSSTTCYMQLGIQPQVVRLRLYAWGCVCLRLCAWGCILKAVCLRLCDWGCVLDTVCLRLCACFETNSFLLLTFLQSDSICIKFQPPPVARSDISLCTRTENLLLIYHVQLDQQTVHLLLNQLKKNRM